MTRGGEMEGALIGRCILCRSMVCYSDTSLTEVMEITFSFSLLSSTQGLAPQSSFL